MVVQWNKLGGRSILKNYAVVVRWVGFEETRYIDGQCYDRCNQDYGIDSQWNKLDFNIPVSR